MNKIAVMLSFFYCNNSFMFHHVLWLNYSCLQNITKIKLILVDFTCGITMCYIFQIFSKLKLILMVVVLYLSSTLDGIDFSYMIVRFTYEINAYHK